jgi:UDP-2,4-diacetamido-2,4,6-trideoxy-beta-L-altropyranose hydrolase
MTLAPVVLIRADANVEIGSGHLMRCAALGARLLQHGAQVHFVCVGLPAPLATWLRACGFALTEMQATKISGWRADLDVTHEVARLTGMIDLLIVDHYQLDLKWEHGMRPYVRRILVIDDLADRDHDCDLLLDQNLHDGAQNRYEKHVPQGTIQFHGPKYALLRTEFDRPGLVRIRDGNIKQLLVFFGGTDPGNQTTKVIDALRAFASRALQSIVVLGPAHPYRDAVRNRADGLPNVRVIDVTDQMATLIAQADLAIGTCGGAAWERCALGLPSLVVVTAENQREDAEILHRLGAVLHLGDADEIDVDEWRSAIQLALDDPERIHAMGLAAGDVMANRQTTLADLERTLVNGMH